mgnify:FL=1
MQAKVNTQTNSKTKKQLKSRIIEGASAPEKVLRDMWQLRLDFLNLSITKDQDWLKFSAICKRENTLLITFYDHDDVLQGYYTFAFCPVAHENRKALLVHAKYYYVRPAFRGHPKITSSSFKLIPGMIWRFGFRQIYVVAFSFPTSYVSLSRTFGGAMAIQNESTPDWEKTVLEDYASSQTGNDWDNKQKLIFNQNIPIGEDRPASDNVKDLNLQFQSMNPDWKDGISMPIMMKFDLATIKSVIKTNLRRKRRQ